MLVTLGLGQTLPVAQRCKAKLGFEADSIKG
jgi:hypothetical protein